MVPGTDYANFIAALEKRRLELGLSERQFCRRARVSPRRFKSIRTSQKFGFRPDELANVLRTLRLAVQVIVVDDDLERGQRVACMARPGKRKWRDAA